MPAARSPFRVNDCVTSSPLRYRGAFGHALPGLSPATDDRRAAARERWNCLVKRRAVGQRIQDNHRGSVPQWVCKSEALRWNDTILDKFFIDNNTLSHVYAASMQKSPFNSLVSRCLLVAFLPLAVAVAASAGSDVVNVRLGLHSDRTRVVLDLSGPAEYRLEPQTNPTRVVITIENGAIRLAGGAPEGRGLIKSLRMDQSGGVSRMILELAQSARVARSGSLPASGSTPARIFVDLEPGAPDPIAAPAGDVPGAAATKVPGPPAAPALRPVQVASTETVAIPDMADARTEGHGFGAGSVTAARQYPVPPAKPAPPLVAAESAAQIAMAMPAPVVPPKKPGAGEGGRVRVIVLDAGHGGRDPGAVGANGTMEKDITLRMAKELRVLLESTGRYRVILTRADDELLALRQRIDVARTAAADLFISLHADHIEKSTLRGASVYTLSENASDAEAAALAARENKEDLITGIDLSSQSAMVTSILIDLAQRETKNLSARFASVLTEELADHTLVLRNSHRFAGFVVLKAPDVPSVLLELGYLSNPDDEAALVSARHRRVLGDAIREALDRYFEWQHGFR